MTLNIAKIIQLYSALEAELELLEYVVQSTKFGIKADEFTEL
jgi:hypothetical protein